MARSTRRRQARKAPRTLRKPWDIPPVLHAADGEVGDKLRQQILGFGDRALRPLLSILDAPPIKGTTTERDNAAALSAADLLAELGDKAAIEPVLDVIVRLDPLDGLYDALVKTLHALQPEATAAALARLQQGVGANARAALGEVLASGHVRAPQIREALIELFDHEPSLAANLLGKYGDTDALPILQQRLDAAVIDPSKGLYGAQIVIELGAAIVRLGAPLTPLQTAKVAAVRQVRERSYSDMFQGAEEGMKEALMAALSAADEVI